MIRLGGPVYAESNDPEELIRRHRELGFSAAFCPAVDDPTRREEMVAAFREADIVLAEVGAYCINILDTDETIRQQNIATITKRLRYADSVGAGCCVMHGGSVQTGGWGQGSVENFSRESFERTVATVQGILDDAQPQTTKLVLETESYLFPDSPEVYLELLQAIDRPGFGVHLDPINITNTPRRFFFNGDFMRECVRTLGPHVVSAHAKDAVIGKAATVHISEAPAGQGQLDYDAYLTELDALEQDVTLMIEHISGLDQCWECRNFLYAKAEELGIAFHPPA